MFGIQEIIVFAGIAGALLFGPRLRRLITEGTAKPEPRRVVRKQPGKLSVFMRLAIVGSVALPIATIFYFEPWRDSGNLRLFLYVGVAPVVVGWCAWWVSRGGSKR